VREELIEIDRNYYLVDSLLETNVPVLTHKSNRTPHEDGLTHQPHQGSQEGLFDEYQTSPAHCIKINARCWRAVASSLLAGLSRRACGQTTGKTSTACIFALVLWSTKVQRCWFWHTLCPRTECQASLSDSSTWKTRTL